MLNTPQVVIAVIAMAVSLPTVAADRGFYFGVLGGRAEYDIDRQRNEFIVALGSGVIPSPLDVVVDGIGTVVSPESADDTRESAWGATLGYRILDYMAAELSYVDLGSFRAREEIMFPSNLGGTVTLRQELKTTSPSISVLGIIPATEQWDLYLRLGLVFAHQDLTHSISGSGIEEFASTSENTNAALWGAGLQFNWRARWTARLEFQRYDGVGTNRMLGKADIDLISLGLLYRL